MNRGVAAPAAAVALGLGRKRSCAALQIGLDPDERFVAIAIARRAPAERSKRSPERSAWDDCLPSEGIVPRPPQLLLLLGERPGHLDRQIVSSMAGIPS
jgi:hypothetical protein